MSKNGNEQAIHTQTCRCWWNGVLATLVSTKLLPKWSRQKPLQLCTQSTYNPPLYVPLYNPPPQQSLYTYTHLHHILIWAPLWYEALQRRPQLKEEQNDLHTHTRKSNTTLYIYTCRKACLKCGGNALATDFNSFVTPCHSPQRNINFTCVVNQ